MPVNQNWDLDELFDDDEPTRKKVAQPGKKRQKPTLKRRRGSPASPSSSTSYTNAIAMRGSESALDTALDTATWQLPKLGDRSTDELMTSVRRRIATAGLQFVLAGLELTVIKERERGKWTRNRNRIGIDERQAQELMALGRQFQAMDPSTWEDAILKLPKSRRAAGQLARSLTTSEFQEVIDTEEAKDATVKQSEDIVKKRKIRSGNRKLPSRRKRRADIAYRDRKTGRDDRERNFPGLMWVVGFAARDGELSRMEDQDQDEFNRALDMLLKYWK